MPQPYHPVLYWSTCKRMNLLRNIGYFYTRAPKRCHFGLLLVTLYKKYASMSSGFDECLRHLLDWIWYLALPESHAKSTEESLSHFPNHSKMPARSYHGQSIFQSEELAEAYSQASVEGCFGSLGQRYESQVQRRKGNRRRNWPNSNDTMAIYGIIW